LKGVALVTGQVWFKEHFNYYLDWYHGELSDVPKFLGLQTNCSNERYWWNKAAGELSPAYTGGQNKRKGKIVVSQ
jgi:hypothetical protein